MSIFVRAAAGLLLLGILEGCPKAAPSPPLADLAVEGAGCAAITRGASGAVCEIGARRSVRLVLPAGASEVRVRAQRASAEGESPVDAVVTAHDEAVIVAVQVPEGTAKLVVDATVAGKRARGSLGVAEETRLPWLDDARAARSKGEVDRAHALATEHENDPEPAPRALAKGLLARIALGRGRVDDAVSLFREAVELHRRAGRVSDAADDSFALAFALHQRGQRYTEARAVLDAAAPEIALYPEGRARDPYYRGSLAGETGDHRRALSLLRDAERRARRLGMSRLERNARSALALEMQELGRAAASLSILAALEAELDRAAQAGEDAPTACERIEVANNRGWGALLVNEAALADGEPATEDARGPLERALSIDGCADTYVRASAQANLARLALASGDVATAERRLREARSAVKEPRGTERLAWLELDARIQLARGNARAALELIDDGLALARASMLQLSEWSLLVARGEVLEALGSTNEAIEALRAAEDVLDDATLLVPLGEGRGAFVGGRSRSARALLGLLVKARRFREASLAGRRVQGRVLAGVERALRLEQLSPAERARWEEAVRAYRSARAAIDAEASNDWKLPADALARTTSARAARGRALRSALEAALAVLARPSTTRGADGGAADAVDSGVLELDIHPDMHGFVAIASAASGATSHRVPSPRGASPEELGRALFDPMGEKLSRASVVRIRAWGAWRAVDVHALPWRGTPLVERVPVEYSIGLGEPTAAASDGHVVVVGDPTSDLPTALEEARAVAAALEEKTGHVRLLVRDDAASRAVTDALRGAARLHYAGHGVFEGEEGWDSALPLAAGGRLDVSDILSLAPAPRTVVLAGCEAAKSSGEAEGLGLAQAFLAAGSREVLAPVRKVSDALAGKLATKLYAGGPEAKHSLAHAARAAVLATRAEEPASDWAAFRVLVP
jgi:tetratricopeptide (TPR) repeat protein